MMLNLDPQPLSATPSNDGVAPDNVPMEPREIHLRAYTTDSKNGPKNPFIKPRPSERVLVFDTETKTDASQHLRFGAFQVYDGLELFRRGFFYDADGLSEGEINTLHAYVHGTEFELMSKDEFVEDVFFSECADFDGTCVGFNLPFDLTRLAIGYGTAKGGRRSSTFRNGFSLKLSNDPYRPRLKWKHASSHLSFIQFAASKRPKTKRQKKTDFERPKGFFCDVRTAASALLAQSHSLESLAEALAIPTKKSPSKAHGEKLSFDYVTYAMNDVQCTWECFAALKAKLESYPLPDTELHELYSEASLGKAYLRAMGIKPWRNFQPDFPEESLGQIISTYFGGRSEVSIRRQVTQVVYCDFLSMYPTVNTLMGMSRYLVSTGITEKDVTNEVRSILETWTTNTLCDPSNWHKLHVIVQVIPDDDVFPVRSIYGDALPRNETNKTANIGLNRLSCEKPLWFTLADCLASKLLTGKAPKVVQALRFSPKQMQDNLQPVALSGNSNYLIDPKRDDFFKRVIQLRRDVVAQRDDCAGTARARLNDEQKSLKILANATSYGIFMEFTVDDLDKPISLKRYGYDGQVSSIMSKVVERPGAYFHPLVATLITGAARLMLAMAEAKALEQGLDWVFCDTDGIAFAKPEDMQREEFVRRTLDVCGAFRPLNPYGDTDSILQIEDENYASTGNEQRKDLATAPPLFCYAVSAKRYALFNLDGDQVRLRKASAHGLGHLVAPFVDPNSQEGSNAKVAHWHNVVWSLICEAVLRGEDDNGAFFNDERFQKPATSQYTANSPHQLSWFSKHNHSLPLREQVGPGNFLRTFQTRNLERLSATDHQAASWRHNGYVDPKPTAAFETDPELAAQHAFDRQTGMPVPRSFLKTYAEVLRDYHLHAEAKFHGGFGGGRGKLRRRHIQAIAVRHIGKEAHNWQEQALTSDGDISIPMGSGLINPSAARDDIRRAREAFGVRQLSLAAGVGDGVLKSICDGCEQVDAEAVVKLLRAGYFLSLERENIERQKAKSLGMLKRSIDLHGISAIVSNLGADPSNLRKILAGQRPMSDRLHRSILQSELLQSTKSPNETGEVETVA